MTRSRNTTITLLLLNLLICLGSISGFSPQPVRKALMHKKSTLIVGLNAENNNDPLQSSSSSSSSSSRTTSSLYQDIPKQKPWTFGILTSGFPPQQLLVPFVKFITFNVWKLMMNELVTHDEKGRFVRESFQAGNNPSPLELPDDEEEYSRYKLYLGNPCPWCHR